MAEATLQQVLGSNATQDTSSITLSKNDLGLTASNCTADQIILAIMLKAKQILTEVNFETELEQNTYIQDGFPGTVTKDNTLFIVKQLVLNFAKPDTQTVINPNDY